MGIWQGKRQKPLIVQVKELTTGQVKEIELIWDRKLMLAITYEDGLAGKENTGIHMAALDPGEIHSIAAVCENNQGIIITGRQLHSIKYLRNKKLPTSQIKEIELLWDRKLMLAITYEDGLASKKLTKPIPRKHVLFAAGRRK